MSGERERERERERGGWVIANDVHNPVRVGGWGYVPAPGFLFFLSLFLFRSLAPPFSMEYLTTGEHTATRTGRVFLGGSKTNGGNRKSENWAAPGGLSKSPPLYHTWLTPSSIEMKLLGKTFGQSNCMIDQLTN